MASITYPVLTFTTIGGSAWDDGIAEDGEGGSYNLPLDIQIGLLGAAPGTPIEWRDSSELGSSDQFIGLTTFSNTSGDTSWQGFIIKTKDSSAFELNGFQWYDYYGVGGGVTVYGFLDGAVVAQSNFQANFNNSVATVNLGMNFDLVDEVRITYPSTGYGTINNLQLAGIDTVGPSVTGVYAPASGIYAAGQTFYFTLNFDEAVTVALDAGRPQLALVIGTQTVYADYVSGSGSSVLAFRYTVQPGQLDANGITVSSLELNGATITDAVGNAATLTLNNVGATSGVLVDGVPPVTVISGAILSADTGQSVTDFVTRTAPQTISGTLSAPLASGEAVQVSFDNGSTWTAAVASAGSGIWTLAGVTLSGSNILQVKVTDVAGNSGPVYTQAYVLDTTAPTVTITSDRSSLKAGETATITFTFSEDPGLTFTWDGSAGDAIVSGGTLSAISGSGTTRTATFTPAAVTDGGTATISVAAASYIDRAGNFGGAGATPSISFDTLAPAVPSTPDLTGASDSGISATDNLTNDTTPTLTGTAEEGSTVTLYDGATVVGSGVTVGGVWSITTTGLASGTHQITAIARDAAGNVSNASSSFALTIDTIAPIAIPSASTPGDDVTEIAPDSTIVLRFDGPVEIGTGGSIILYNVTDGTVLETIAYNSATISGWGSAALTIDPSSPLPGGKTIAVQWNASAFQDRAGNFVAANTTNTFYNFIVKEDPVAPTASNLTQTVGFLEDGGSVALGDIIVTDANSGETVTATLVLSNPAAGSLSFGTYGSAVSSFNAATGVWTVAGSVADVNAALANVAFTPSPDWSQTVTIATRIRDAAGTGPVDGTITLSATPLNDAPASGNGTLTLIEDSQYVIKIADFAFADPVDAPAPNAFLSIVIDALPSRGALTLNGAALTAEQEISIADIVGGNLVFTPGANEHGAGSSYSSFAFRVRDNGGTAHGGINTSALYTMRIDVSAVNDPADVGGDLTGSVREDVATTATGVVTASDVDAGEASFAAMADARGTYGTFSFDHLTSRWAYLLDNSSPAVQSLQDGEVRQETFTVRTIDGTEQIIAVLVNGTSDPNGTDGDQTLSGGAGQDILFSGAGSDRLFGRGGNDRLDGGSGNDTVSGGSGNDRVYGGSGNDRVSGGSGADNVYGGSGYDHVYGNAGNDRLYGDAGNDRLSGGSGHDIIMGGSGRDTISGGSGDDRIYGGLGADVLSGGAGRDSFVLDTKLGKGEVDTIHGFNPWQDRILLDNAIFKNLPGRGTLDWNTFQWGDKALGADVRILYDFASGALLYDADGNGSGVAVKFAKIDPWLWLTYDNFRII
jgi:VCBS repeat-containing protein